MEEDFTMNNTTYSAGTGIGLSGTSFYLPIPRVAESCNALPGAASLRFREYTAGFSFDGTIHERFCPREAEKSIRLSR